jgi:hypothetical protein
VVIDHLWYVAFALKKKKKNKKKKKTKKLLDKIWIEIQQHAWQLLQEASTASLLGLTWHIHQKVFTSTCILNFNNKILEFMSAQGKKT